LVIIDLLHKTKNKKWISPKQNLPLYSYYFCVTHANE